jgi:hypothetical protein
MSAGWAIPMLVGGGLFAGGVVSIAWERIPTWRAIDLPNFQTAFAHTLRRVDRLQPALLAVCLISTTGFALSEGGAARIFAVLAAASSRQPGSFRFSADWSRPERNGPQRSWRS